MSVTSYWTVFSNTQISDSFLSLIKHTLARLEEGELKYVQCPDKCLNTGEAHWETGKEATFLHVFLDHGNMRNSRSDPGIEVPRKSLAVYFWPCGMHRNKLQIASLTPALLRTCSTAEHQSSSFSVPWSWESPGVYLCVHYKVRRFWLNTLDRSKWYWKYISLIHSLTILLILRVRNHGPIQCPFPSPGFPFETCSVFTPWCPLLPLLFPAAWLKVGASGDLTSARPCRELYLFVFGILTFFFFFRKR